jgi:hypothetical protein
VPVPALGDLAGTGFAAAGSPEEKAWVAGVPSLLATSLASGTSPSPARSSAWVQRGRPAGRPGGGALALKLTWPPDQVRGDAETLAAWRARGVVELVACDVPRGALLLERLVEADIADAVFLASGNRRDEEQADTWAE